MSLETNREQGTPWRDPRTVLLLLAIVALALLLTAVAARTFDGLVLVDFVVTFYRAAGYLLNGENIYLNAYPSPLNDRQYPPFGPIWMIGAVVPFRAHSLPLAQAIRFVIDLAAIPLLAYICARLAGLKSVGLIILLAIAPWNAILLFAGQWTGAMLLGTVLCYLGVRRTNAGMTAVGLWLLWFKFHIAALVILAALLFAWRNKILLKTLALLGMPVLIFSIAQPTWMFDVTQLYIDRLANPRAADSVLLLPGYPWSQLLLLVAGTLGFVIHLCKSPERQPTLWLWVILATASLVGALHTFAYDWLMLMLPLAWLLRDRRAVFLIVALYAYAFAWALGELAFIVSLPSPAIIPSIVLLATLIPLLKEIHGPSAG
jgi:hypothetical protein